MLSPTKGPPGTEEADGCFTAAFSCATDPLKSTKKDPAHADFRWVATVHADALGGTPDTPAEDDTCPRPTLPGGLDPRPDPTHPIKDTGCGGKLPDKTLGADVTTDVFVKSAALASAGGTAVVQSRWLAAT